MINDIKISVITVCLNCVETIKQTLDNVASQTYENIEHVIIDGGSVDGTAEIIGKYMVDYFISEKDDGIYYAMEKGVKASSGDILFFLNSGDLFFDINVCEDVIKFFRKTGVDIIFGDFIPYLTNPQNPYDHGLFFPGRLCRNDMVKNRRYLQKQNIHHQAIFYKRIIFDCCSFFHHLWPRGSDYILNVKALAEHGFRAKYFNITLTKFALGGLSTSNFKREIEEYNKLSMIINELYFQTQVSFDENEYIDKSMKNSLDKIFNEIKYSKLFQYVKSISFWPLKRLAILFNKILFKVGPASSIIDDFFKRTDSIYKINIDNKVTLENLKLEILDIDKKIDQVKIEINNLYNRALDQVRTELNSQLKDVLSTEIENIRTLQKINKITNINIGKILNQNFKNFNEIQDAGYRITSQFDEDGIIQYIIRKINIKNRIFIEFGIENYSEANTRFLLEKDNWSGLIIDHDFYNIEKIKSSEIYWRHNIKAICAFIKRENINDLIMNAGFKGDIGLLSIDIDGMDYWVWDAIEVVSPIIVICEYNSIFGNVASVTVPYDPEFDRAKKHYSMLYAGASLTALSDLGKKKGYSLVASNTFGNNSFFIRNDCKKNFNIKSVKQAYVKAQFREARDINGKMSYLTIEEGVKLIEDLPVYETRIGSIKNIKDVHICYD